MLFYIFLDKKMKQKIPWLISSSVCDCEPLFLYTVHTYFFEPVQPLWSSKMTIIPRMFKVTDMGFLGLFLIDDVTGAQ